MADYYEFFFSFASADWKKGKKDDVEKFFRDLQDKLRTFGFKGTGFFAPDAIERGREWEDKLRKALPASHILVPVYSPNYFKSVWCGREWEVFWQRQQENKILPPQDVAAPDVILPVIWTAEFLELPTRVPKVQYKAQASDSPVYMDKGLGYMMQSPKRYAVQYTDFVHHFAKELAEMVRNQGAAKMRAIPNLDDLDLSFPVHHKRGLSHVRYVFLAGRRDEMQRLRAQVECYGTFESRQDWRPCFPDVDRLAGELARSIAAENGKAYEFVEPHNATELLRAVRDASARNNIIVIIVDPWSLHLNLFKEFAEKFDAEPFPTSGVVVIWNGKDSETAAKMAALRLRIGDHFHGRLSRQEYYNTEVGTLEELREALIATFTAARERLVEGGQIPRAGTSNFATQPILHVTP